MKEFLVGLREFVFSLRDNTKQLWLYMLKSPWRDTESTVKHWVVWLVGWAWTLAGLVSGALVAPIFVDLFGLANTPYQDWFVIAVAVMASFIVQLFGMELLVMWMAVSEELGERGKYFMRGCSTLAFLDMQGCLMRGLLDSTLIPIAILPLTSVIFSIVCFIAWAGAGQRFVTIAFVGGLLIKTFAIPLIKGIVTGALFRWFMKWLRGGKNTKNT